MVKIFEYPTIAFFVGVFLIFQTTLKFQDKINKLESPQMFLIFSLKNIELLALLGKAAFFWLASGDF